MAPFRQTKSRIFVGTGDGYLFAEFQYAALCICLDMELGACLLSIVIIEVSTFRLRFYERFDSALYKSVDIILETFVHVNYSALYARQKR